MGTYTELNLEAGMPTSTEALDRLKASLERYRKIKIGCVLIIHGYGSSGRGGVIRDRVRTYLTSQKTAGKVKTVIYGEDFSIFNFEALRLKNTYRELEPILRACNHGVTVVEI